MHAVFDVSPDSKYRKDFWYRYAISTRTAVETVRGCVGDWIIFRHTGSRGYIAVARVDDVIPDFERPGFSAALIGEYLPFTSQVPFKVGKRYAELQFRLTVRSLQIGQAVQGHPIRELSPLDFREIALAGFARTGKVEGAEISIAREVSGFAEQTGELWDYEPAPRDIRNIFSRRAFRDANFRLEVCGSYGYRCAFTNLSLWDGQACEVEAAHIWSVRDLGPDIRQNGLCINRTLHWAVDHHLISVDESYCPMVRPGAIPDSYLKLFPPPGHKIHLPRLELDWPAQTFLDRHRAAFRKKYDL